MRGVARRGRPRTGHAAMPGRGSRLDPSSEAELEERVPRMIDEVDPARVVEGSSVALELVGEPAIERRRGGSGTRARTAVLGHEVVSAFTLGDVVAGGRCGLDTLAKDAGHEQREIADVPAHRDFVFRLEVRRIFQTACVSRSRSTTVSSRGITRPRG